MSESGKQIIHKTQGQLLSSALKDGLKKLQNTLKDGCIYEAQIKKVLESFCKMKQYIDRYRPGTDTDIILDKTFRSKTQYEDISSVYYFYAAVFKELLNIVDIQRPYYMPIEEMISTTLKFRMLETGIPMDKFEQNKNDVLDLHRMYSSRFPDDPLKQASGKIGKICSEKIKQIYLAKSKIDSYNTITLKEYSDFTNPRY